MAVPRAVYAALDFITRRPLAFPMILWVMLVMEERSLMLSRRYAKLPADMVEPHYAAAYKAHLEDEVRHVQIDWHLLERFYLSRPHWLRRLNANLLEWFIRGLLLKPRRANVRLMDLQITEHPELSPRRTELLSAVRALEHNIGYRQLMYSTESTPIGSALFGRLPEFARLRRMLYAEVPK